MYNDDFSTEEFQQGKEYREKWYATRNLELVHDWYIISEQAKSRWAKEAKRG